MTVKGPQGSPSPVSGLVFTAATGHQASSEDFESPLSILPELTPHPVEPPVLITDLPLASGFWSPETALPVR